MHMGGDVCGNGVARHLGHEAFREYAARELSVAPPWARGVCFNPGCSAPFEPRRSWQVYCSAGCEALGKAEMRRWGHRMALPLLVHRLGKYEQRDGDIIEVTRAARRYVTQAQSLWLADRARRRQEVPHG